MDDLGIDLATDNDTLVEGPEDYRLTISAATSTTGATVVLDTVTPATIVTTTITDNDTATWSLTGTSSLAEAHGQLHAGVGGDAEAGETAKVDLTLSFPVGGPSTDPAEAANFVEAFLDTWIRRSRPTTRPGTRGRSLAAATR